LWFQIPDFSKSRGSSSHDGKRSIESGIAITLAVEVDINYYEASIMNFKSILAVGLGIATLSLSLPAFAKDQATLINPNDSIPGKVAADRNPKPPGEKGRPRPPATEGILILIGTPLPAELPNRKAK
jgi:hypothetical protein